MAYSYQEFIGDGVTQTYTIPFSYVKRSEVNVFVGGTQTSAFEFLTDATINITAAPASGAIVRISRITDLETRAVDFVAGAVLSEEDLDTAVIQVFNGAQEAVDKSNEALFKTPDGKWDAQSRVIKNLATPVDAGDAVNKGTIDSLYPYVATVGGAIAKVNTVGDAISKVSTVADNITSVNTVALNNTNVSKVAAIDARVTTVANNDANVTTVADNDANVTTVAGVSPKVTTVANNIVKVVAVADNTTNINAVFANASNITAVAGNETNINAVFGNATNINSVVANAPNINAVVANAPNITAVADNEFNINAVFGNATNINSAVANAPNINAVVANAPNINAVVANAPNINAVVTNAPNINTVVDNIGDVNTVVTNLAAILDAPNQASGAAASAVSAASSAATAAALLDNFDDRYLGAKASDPALDNDGNALIVGALYFNTTDGVMKIYTSSGWIAASSASVATLATFEFVATGGQTVFTGSDANGQTLSYTAPALMVTLNGVRLRPDDDYTATDGVNITLVSAATAGDELVVDAFGNFLVADTYSKAQTDALIGAVDLSSRVAKTGDTMTGTLKILESKTSPSLILQRSSNTVSEGDFIQGIRFANAVDDWYAEVFAEQSTIYADAVGLGFRTQYGTPDRAVRMRIDAQGRVTMPYQPVFHSRASSYLTYSANTLFRPDTDAVNIGNHYSSATGLFTAPVAGVYDLSATFLVSPNGTSGTYLSATPKVNGTSLNNSHGAIWCSNGAFNVSSIAGQFFVYLNANDTLGIVLNSNGTIVLYGTETFMSCRLIG